MAETDGPRLATEDEFPELMSLLDRSFQYERGGMAARYPFVYDPTNADRHAVITQDGKIVSHAAAIPQTLLGNGDSVECWGIGGVATHKQHRGNGYMTQLLEFWLERMDAADVPLAELGGDRQRYANFGWENAGRDYRYLITERSFGDGPVAPPADVDAYDGADDRLDRVLALYEETTWRVNRTREQLATILDQRGLETLIHDGADGPAYVAFTRESRKRTVPEFGGSESGVLSLLGHVLHHFDVDRLTVFAPPTHPLDPTLKRISTGWRMQSHRKLNIRDLSRLFAAWTDSLEAKWLRNDVPSSGTLSLGLTGEVGGVRLSYEPDGLDVERYEGHPDIELGRLEMTRLLFGFPDDARGIKRRHPVLETLLPLEFYIHHSQHV